MWSLFTNCEDGKPYCIRKDLIENKALRKQVIKDDFIKFEVNAIEKCINDLSRIEEDVDKITHRERVYNVDRIFPDGVDKDFLMRERELSEEVAEHGYWFDGVWLSEDIYYNKNIRDIYNLLYLENLEYDNMALSLREIFFPAKIPTQDYFPFVEYEIGTKIPVVLTPQEKEDGFNEELEIDDEGYYWSVCMFWVNSQSLFINVDEFDISYLKQVGKNTHLITIHYAT